MSEQAADPPPPPDSAVRVETRQRDHAAARGQTDPSGRSSPADRAASQGRPRPEQIPGAARHSRQPRFVAPFAVAGSATRCRRSGVASVQRSAGFGESGCAAIAETAQPGTSSTTASAAPPSGYGARGMSSAT